MSGCLFKGNVSQIHKHNSSHLAGCHSYIIRAKFYAWIIGSGYEEFAAGAEVFGSIDFMCVQLEGTGW